MSRITKYRAWHKTEKRMIYPEEIRNREGDLWAIGFHGLPIAVDRDSLKADEITGWNIDHILDHTEFTGRRDKNGREIYEGDIVLTHNEQEEDYPVESTYRGVVTYKDEKAMFVICQSHDTYTPALSNTTIRTWEVIGNIYESPELLPLEFYQQITGNAMKPPAFYAQERAQREEQYGN